MQVAGIKCDGNYCYLNIPKSESKFDNKKTNEVIADEVIKGLWGNGVDRKVKLTEAGYNYTKIQEIVNNKLAPKKKTNTQIADEVIKGKWGNQPERQKLLEQAGYDYNAVQKIVNRKMSK